MAATITTLHGIINSLLPFTRPGTPLFQDIVHTLAICALLYFLPRLAEWQEMRRKTATPPATHIAQAEEPHEQDRPQSPARAADHAHSETTANSDTAARHAAPPEAADAAGPEERDAPRAQPRRARDQASVGAKKAKSLARREQRRAYHEFVRNQAEQQRAVDASTAETREAAVGAERERRAEAERRLDEQRGEQRRSARAEREGRERVEAERRVACERIIKGRVRAEGAVDLRGVAEELFIDEVFAMRIGDVDADRVWQEKLVWVERLARAIPGLLGRKTVDGEAVVTMITASRWIVELDRAVLDAAYTRSELLARDRLRAGGDGRVGMEEFGHVLEDVLMAGAAG